MASGQELKQAGMEQALQAHRQWQEEFREAAVALADSGVLFTSEDVLDVVGLPTGGPGLHRNNAVGAMMNALARQKVIVKTGRHVPSRRNLSHGAELTQWVGVGAALQRPGSDAAALMKVGSLHSPDVAGVCLECEKPHPCPTYAVVHP